MNLFASILYWFRDNDLSLYDLTSSGNTTCRKGLSSNAFAFCSVPLELSRTFSWVCVSCCTASQ